MKCPYQDIGCWYIDDVTHECEARWTSDCRHEKSVDPEPKQSRNQQDEDDEE